MPSRVPNDGDYRALAGFRHQLRRFLAFSEQAARTAGIEPRQHQLLLALRGLPEDARPSVQVLADRLVLKHHTVVELIDRLEAAGMIKRDRAIDDKRRARVTITSRGEAVLRKLSDVHLQELQRLAPALVSSLYDVLRTARAA